MVLRRFYKAPAFVVAFGYLPNGQTRCFKCTNGRKSQAIPPAANPPRALSLLRINSII
jgi:hypothetical protein